MVAIRKAKNFVHALQAQIAGFLYGLPAKKIFTIGVTGTDGKTTTASLIFHILKTAGKNPALISTVAAQIGDEVYETGLHTTTPSAFTLQKYIKKAVDNNCDFLILETTSHALDQNRVRGVDFKIGVLTNISHDHLDYHKTQEEYIRAKSKLFSKTGIAILNRDDESFEEVKKLCQSQGVYSYSVEDKADFYPGNIEVKLPGEYSFNFENFMAAISVAKILDIESEHISLALASFKFPQGRQEVVYDKQFRVIIDFAHTPNSFKRVLPELKKSTKGKLIHVFGSAGERDASKRPLMGEISAIYADMLVLTAEDPRNEKIQNINTQIKLGIKNYSGEIIEIDDREKAIEFAISNAKKGDTVVITGKGHEKSMNLGNGEIDWSDHEAVRLAIASQKIDA